MPRPQVRARVQLMVEIELSMRWDDQVQADQVARQATEEAVVQLHQYMRDTCRIVGKPSVVAILAPASLEE